MNIYNMKKRIKIKKRKKKKKNLNMKYLNNQNLKKKINIIMKFHHLQINIINKINILLQMK